jgi:hypothetical protein
MAELPPFEQWLSIAIVEAMTIGVEVSKDVVSISTPPSSFATTYHSMYACGNHLRVASAKSHLSTANLEVVTIFFVRMLIPFQ